MAAASPVRADKLSRLESWLLERPTDSQPESYYEPEGKHPQHPWWQVMCLTGVDYFSTLGYQPGIAALAAGALSPLATLVLVLVTLFGALPMYRRVAAESPHGDGSISMLEHLLGWWYSKLFVLALIGFVATGFVITITLSAADATAHVVENPFTRFLHGYEVPVTLLLIGLLGTVFLRGFTDAIGLAVVLVALYLGLNLVVVVTGLLELAREPRLLAGWSSGLQAAYGSPLPMLAGALLVFPRLALGLSGFETGVVVMPLVQGGPDDDPAQPAGRIRNTRRLLTTAAAIMSLMLLSSSLVTTLLIPPAEFQPDGSAYGRALAYLAHTRLGELFGSLYDASTILILWFAGASAMAGLLNIVPRYLPRYGMAPEWARVKRPLVLIFTAICTLVTIVFRADVEAQAGAYATGVLALMTSATVAVTLSARRRGQRIGAVLFGLISLIFVYTTLVTVLERPEGLHIASLFIAAIVVTSILSRVWRVTELRVSGIDLDDTARRFVEEAKRGDTIRIIAHDPEARSADDYALQQRAQWLCNHLPAEEPVLFFEVTVTDPSEFAPRLKVHGERVGEYRVLRAESSSVPNAIAAFLLHLRDTSGRVPHAYFGWSERGPLGEVLQFLLFGEGDVPAVTHEVLRRAEKDPNRRPVVHVA